MTKFECAEKIVDTLDEATVRKLAAKQVAGLMKQPRYELNGASASSLIREAFDGIARLNKKEMDFAQAWYDHLNRI